MKTIVLKPIGRGAFEIIINGKSVGTAFQTIGGDYRGKIITRKLKKVM